MMIPRLPRRMVHGMTTVLRALIFLGLIPLLPGADEPTRGVDISLISETRSIEPGKPFLLGLTIHHHEDFHTYWKSPGIVGMATSIKWSLPAGFQAGPVQWPAPEVVDMSGHPAHGYTRDILLITEITPPAQLTEATYTLNGAASWMACAASCHPGHKTLSITLPVKTGQGGESPDRKRFQTTLANIPNSSHGWSGTWSSADEGASIALKLTPPVGSPPIKTCYFFSSDGQISSAPPQQADRLPNGTWRIRAKRSEFGPIFKPNLPGILQITHSDGTRRSASVILKIDEKTPALTP